MLSKAPCPPVRYALRREGGLLRVAVEVDRAGSPGMPRVELGVAAAAAVVLQSGNAVQVPGAAKTGGAGNSGPVRMEFSIATARLITTPADWSNLRMALAVSWPGGPLGMDRQLEVLNQRGGSPHEGLAADDTLWLPLSLNDYTAAVAEKRDRIVLRVPQPMPGKMTVVVEDATGKRVRNLVAGLPTVAGPTDVVWDGLDDDGKVLPPGNYRWRSISHPGVTPQYLFSFANARGSNHGTLHAATTNGTFTFLGTSVSEGGHDIVALDGEGQFRQGYVAPMGMGLKQTALAADGKYLYVARDGNSWGQQAPDTRRPDWKDSHTLALLRFDIATATPVDYAGVRFVPVSKQEWGPGSAGKREYGGVNLTGMALHNGKLFISCRAENGVAVVDSATGQREAFWPVKDPGDICATSDGLLIIVGNGVARLDPGTGRVSPLIAAQPSPPQGIAVDKDGRIYLSDNVDHTIKVFTAQGQPDGQMGEPGGAYRGPYKAARLIDPRGITIGADGLLWITERRWTPKRYTAWDTGARTVKREYFGPTNYGASGAGFDDQDVTRWVGQNTLWKVDYAAKSAAPVALLGSNSDARHWRFVRRGTKTYLIGFGQGTYISELLDDGSVRDRVALGSTHYFCFHHNWKPPAGFIDAYNKAYPDRPYKSGAIMPKGPGVLWQDANGDGEMQENEVEITRPGVDIAGAYWGQDYTDLNLRLPVTRKGKTYSVSLAPSTSTVQELRYPSFASAIDTAQALEVNAEGETVTDRKGNLIFNSDPKMRAYSPAGKLLWSYPNRWAGVHGSHLAPLPQVGVMQGAITFLGTAPLDEQTDVFVMNGNHGRFFVLTSDGMYLDEMFKDVRVSTARDEYMIGGESFGGFFGKSLKDGRYYLQAGGIEYRIFQLKGLDQTRRSAGQFSVSAAQASAAESALKRRIAASNQVAEATLPLLQKAPAIDGNEADWAGVNPISWARDRQFPVTVRAAIDETHLYLHYTVADDSPWVNNGKDWQLLFKSGDSVDIQLGTDGMANPRRGGPVPGDLRLLIAPFQGEEIAVLYRHRVPGAAKPVAFTSPWRAEKVDEVRRLKGTKIKVIRDRDRYRLEAAVPLQGLGWQPVPGSTLPADFGVIYGDESGTINLLRNYWSNKATGLVNDVPGEIMLTPNLWGKVSVAPAGAKEEGR